MLDPLQDLDRIIRTTSIQFIHDENERLIRDRRLNKIGQFLFESYEFVSFIFILGNFCLEYLRTIIGKTKSAILKNEKYIFWCFPAISGASV